MRTGRGAWLLFALACLGAPTSLHAQTQTTPRLTLTLNKTALVVAQDATPVTVSVTVGGVTSTPKVTVTGLSRGVAANFAASAKSTGGVLTFHASATTPVGEELVTVTASLSGQTATAPLRLFIAPVVTVVNTVDTAAGINGRMEQFLSTSFQSAEWEGDYFGTGAEKASRQAVLAALGAQHMRMQVVSEAVPMLTHTGTASDWDFTLLDQLLQPVLAIGDKSPELQIGTAPKWMCLADGVTLDVTHHAADFAAMMANIVRYYNKGGFTVGGKHFQSPSKQPIAWWGIFNEFNGNGLSAADYGKLYNTVVPAMLAVDPTIRLSAFEFSDWGLGTGGGGDPMVYLPPFLRAPSQGGVSTQVNVISTHFYASCNQRDPDTSLFGAVQGFADNIAYFRTAIKSRPDLGPVKIWVTENNVNADWSNNGMSECNPGQVFVTDQRGTSPFFAAWRPMGFIRMGRAGNQALYHWAYDADRQYGEVDFNTGGKYLSYWVDKTLTDFYPSTAASPGPEILNLSAAGLTGSSLGDLDLLATRSNSGQVRIMVVDHAIRAATDNNGTGLPRAVVLELGGLGKFSSASLTVLDRNTNPATGPKPVAATPASRMNIALSGYGTAILTLNP